MPSTATQRATRASQGAQQLPPCLHALARVWRVRIRVGAQGGRARACMRCTSSPASAEPAPCLVGGAMQCRTCRGGH
jgi:hypothetical protein